MGLGQSKQEKVVENNIDANKATTREDEEAWAAEAAETETGGDQQHQSKCQEKLFQEGGGDGGAAEAGGGEDDTDTLIAVPRRTPKTDNDRVEEDSVEEDEVHESESDAEHQQQGDIAEADDTTMFAARPKQDDHYADVAAAAQEELESDEAMGSSVRVEILQEDRFGKPRRVSDRKRIKTDFFREDDWITDTPTGRRKNKKKQKRSHSSSSSRHNNADESRSANTNTNEYQCKFCLKTLANTFGLQYHVDHFVCRPELRNTTTGGGGMMQEQEQGSSSSNTGMVARTCPKCKHIFASMQGLNYHERHHVCENKNSSKKRQETAEIGEIRPREDSSSASSSSSH